jgi:hypothetical protein
MPAKNQIFNTIFSAYYFLKVHLHNFSKIKSQKESQKRRNEGFSYYFCMMIEGSGSRSIPPLVDPDPGGPKTCGSGGSGTLLGTSVSDPDPYRQAKIVPKKENSSLKGPLLGWRLLLDPECSL